jgi:hypothetical protein
MESTPLVQSNNKRENLNISPVCRYLTIATLIALGSASVYLSHCTRAFASSSLITHDKNGNLISSQWGSSWSSIAEPFSRVNPIDLGILGIDRSKSSRPGAIFDKLSRKQIPLPTNSWLESLFLGSVTTSPYNRGD